MRSRSPPKPGSQAPLSLTCALRLSSDSSRSPQMAPTAVSSASATTGTPAGTYSTSNATPSEAPITLPSAPAHVFDGLSRGASARRPNRRPNANAPTSDRATPSPRASSKPGPPCGWRASSEPANRPASVTPSDGRSGYASGLDSSMRPDSALDEGDRGSSQQQGGQRAQNHELAGRGRGGARDGEPQHAVGLTHDPAVL